MEVKERANAKVVKAIESDVEEAKLKVSTGREMASRVHVQGGEFLAAIAVLAEADSAIHAAVLAKTEWLTLPSDPMLRRLVCWRDPCRTCSRCLAAGGRGRCPHSARVRSRFAARQAK